MSSFKTNSNTMLKKNNIYTQYGIKYVPKILNIKQKYFLSIVAIFKNESWILKEWLDHYINQGVDHFFLIDNGSTDNSQIILKPYIDKQIVSLIKDPKRFSQKGHYNKYVLPIKKISRWFLVCDLDEFVYARNNIPKISDYLKTLHPLVGCVIIPWKNFGSSGHIQHPRDGVVKNFTKRRLYNSHDKSHTKSIARSDVIENFTVHLSNCKNTIYITSDNKKSNVRDNYYNSQILLNEELLKQSYLHLNHYQIQSVEFWRKIKMTRGDATELSKINRRNMNEFLNNDKISNDIEDNELKDIQSKYIV